MSVKTTPWFVLNSPELGAPLADFYDCCNDIGVLDKKTKELLMVVLASVFRCSSCFEKHVKGALEAGVTKEEVTEALLIAAGQAAITHVAWQREICLKYLT